MATVRTNHLPSLAPYAIRPALAEARLMTEKRVHDVVYALTLTQELCNIEGKIAVMEAALHLGPSAAAQVPDSSGAVPADGPDAKWFRAKSSELDVRLRRVEQVSKIH
jgi:hypothetical protein